MEITFHQNNGIFKIKGNLFLEDFEAETILNKLKEYARNPKKETSFYFKLGHLDGEKAIKFISKIYQILKPLSNLMIYWEHDIDDEDGKELGFDLMQDLKIPLIIKEIDFD